MEYYGSGRSAKLAAALLSLGVLGGIGGKLWEECGHRLGQLPSGDGSPLIEYEHGSRPTVGVFMWPESVTPENVSAASKKYGVIVVLVRGTSGFTSVRPLKVAMENSGGARVYAWITGFERAGGGWSKPWDERVRRKIINTVKAALPYCDAIVLDDSFRYPTNDPVERRRAERAIESLMLEIRRLAHEHGKQVYVCILPEDLSKYSLSPELINRVADKVVVEAYTAEYRKDDRWVLTVFRTNADYFGRDRVVMALHDSPDRVSRQIRELISAGCTEILVFRFGEVGTSLSW